MSKKVVFVEKSTLASGTSLNVSRGAQTYVGMRVGTFVGIYHYAVKVDEKWYEVDNDTGVVSGRTGMKMTSDATRPVRMGVLSLAGPTFKTFNEIREYCEKWRENNPNYSLLATNCQKFALDLAQWLVPSFKLEQPLAQTNAWADGRGSHSICAKG